MSIVRIDFPEALPTAQSDYVKQNDLISASFLSINSIFQIDFILSEVREGSIFLIGGTVYKSITGTAITGTPSNYVKIIPSIDASTASAEFADPSEMVAVVWNSTYGFWDDGSGAAFIFDEGLEMIENNLESWSKNASVRGFIVKEKLVVGANTYSGTESVYFNGNTRIDGTLLIGVASLLGNEKARINGGLVVDGNSTVPSILVDGGSIDLAVTAGGAMNFGSWSSPTFTEFGRFSSTGEFYINSTVNPQNHIAYFRGGLNITGANGDLGDDGISIIGASGVCVIRPTINDVEQTTNDIKFDSTNGWQVEGNLKVYGNMIMYSGSNVDRTVQFASDATLLWDESANEFVFDKNIRTTGFVTTNASKIAAGSGIEGSITTIMSSSEVNIPVNVSGGIKETSPGSSELILSYAVKNAIGGPTLHGYDPVSQQAGSIVLSAGKVVKGLFVVV